MRPGYLSRVFPKEESRSFLSAFVMGFVLFKGSSVAQGASGDDMRGKILALCLKADETVGAIRSGSGLLVGLLRCQACGRKMHVRYWGKGGTNPRYICPGEFYHGGDYCQSLSAMKTDRVFEEELFKAIEPAAIQGSIEACDLINQEYQQRIKYLDRELENVQYEADRAFIQHNQVVMDC